MAVVRKYPIEQRTEYDDKEFCEALEAYRNQDIQESIYSINPIVRMFAILDRRVGKRTLAKIKNEVAASPDWVKQFYSLRCEAEGIAKPYGVGFAVKSAKGGINPTVSDEIH